MFATTSDELVTVCRRELDDAVAPYLWEDPELYGFMTEGFDCLLKRNEVAMKVLTLAITAGVRTVSVPAKLLDIETAHIAGRPVAQKNSNDAGLWLSDDYNLPRDGASALFDDTVTGDPCYFVRDYRLKTLMLVPLPTEDATLEIKGKVTLGSAMEEGAALPTIDSQDLRAVLHYMKHLAYQKHDSATEDLDRAQFHLDHYKRIASERQSQLARERRAPGYIRPDF